MSDTMQAEREAPGPASVIRTTLVVVAVIVLVLLAWQLSEVILLAFAAVLVAIILRSLAGLFEGHTPLREPWSLVLSGLLIAAVIAGFAYLLGAQIASQLATVLRELPDMLSATGDKLGIENLGERLADRVDDMSRRSGLVGKIAGYTSVFVATLANILLVVIAGIYLAGHPGRYRRGMLMLIPSRSRKEAESAFDNAGNALRLWLLGQLVAMIIVGVLITAGLYFIGMPSALALGFLAGVLDFVPLVGPALAALPAILVALSEGDTMVFWVIGLYVLVQQIEGNIVLPLVQRRAVNLPPVLTLFAILSFGVLFGPLGVLLSTPLAVVLYVAVKQLYVRDALGEETTVPGEAD